MSTWPPHLTWTALAMESVGDLDALMVGKPKRGRRPKSAPRGVLGLARLMETWERRGSEQRRAPR